MINKKFTRLAGAAIVGAAMTMGAHAATTYTADDLFIGFTKAGSNQDYLVNIGQASNYSAGTLGYFNQITLSVGNADADLKVVFGDNYASDSTVLWGVVGTTRLSTVGTDPAHTVYASQGGNSIDTPAWGNIGSLSTADSRIDAMASAYKNKTSTVNSSVGIVQNNVGTASNNAFASYQPGGANATGAASNLSFAFFNPTILAPVTSTLGLYRLTPGGSSVSIGTFGLSNGAIGYAVPEPTSAALGLIGTVLMVVRRRRR